MNSLRFLFCALAALSLLAPSGAAAAPADEVKALMEAGRPADAYALGRKHPDELGNPAFDFYFGIAAIDTGHSGEGVLALERYLLNFPDNQSARLQLARGYMALGEDARAREEFEALLRLNPPPDVIATIDRFLDAVRLRETRYRTSAEAFLEIGLGRDTNVNGGVRNPNIFLPNLGDVIVSTAGTKNSDNFLHLAAGGYVSYPVAPGVALFGNGLAELKQHRTDTEFDQGSYAASGGVSVLSERNLYRFGVNYGMITIDDDRYRSLAGASVEWQRQLDEQQLFILGAQVARLRYAAANSARDADFVGLLAGYRKLFTHEWQPLLSLGASVGREDTLAAGREDLARDLYSGRASVSFTPAAKWGVAFGLGYQGSRYKAPDVILGVTRKDRYYAADAAINYFYTRQISFRVEAVWSENRSNIELYSFPRDLVAFKVRYDFK